MKIHIEGKNLNNLPDDKKIVLKDLKIFKNKHDQWCLSFGSENHKYLDVYYNISTTALYSPDDNDNEQLQRIPFSAHGFTIQAGEYDNGDWDWKNVYLVPESKEESDELWGVAAIMPAKWYYHCVIVRMEDFYGDT